MPALESRRVRIQPRTVTGWSVGALPARMSAQVRDVIGGLSRFSSVRAGVGAPPRTSCIGCRRKWRGGAATF